MAIVIPAAIRANIAAKKDIVTIRVRGMVAQVHLPATVSMMMLIQLIAAMSAGRCAKVMIPAIRESLKMVTARPAAIICSRAVAIQPTPAITANAIRMVTVKDAAAAALHPAAVPVAAGVF
jgi:hypothetical protein